MAVSQDIIESYRRPRAVMARLLSYGVREDRALAFLMAACALVFVSRLPYLARQAVETNQELAGLAAYEFMGWLMFWPLMFYALAGVSHVVCRAIGGKGTWYTSRLALFWTFLCGAPVLLLYGLIGGFIGRGTQQDLIGLIWVAAIVFVGFGCFREAHRG